MRRPVALFCVAVLLLTALALPPAGWALATLERGVRIGPLTLAAVLPGPPPAATPRDSARRAHLLFRGPPRAPVPDANSGNPLGEETWSDADDGAGWRRPCCT